MNLVQSFLRPVRPAKAAAPPPAALIGNPYATAAYYPPPGSYFGYGRTPGWNYGQFGRADGAPAPNCAPMCPPGRMMPPGAAERLSRFAAQLRSPLGQWPNMPPLNDCAIQDAAAMTVAAQQKHADSLVTAYGVDSGTVLIPNGTTANIIVTPQVKHIPEKLVLTTAIANNFLITGIFAGVNPLLATTGPITAALFIQDSTTPALKSMVMPVGMDLTVGVQNISGADARFTAAVVGKPVPELL